MYTLGIDIGLKHFGICKLQTNTLCLIDARVFSLNMHPYRKFKESYAVASLFCKHLPTEYTSEVSKVYIETPVPRARKCYWSLYNLIHYHFEHVLNIPCVGVAGKCKYDSQLYEASSLEMPTEKLAYRARKQESIKLFQELSEKHSVESTKQDDIADAFLVAYYGLNCKD